MANTHGFEVVIQARKPVIVKALKGAWKSAECPVDPGDVGRIPEYQDIPAGLVIGGYTIADGQAQIPQNELDANFDTAVPLTSGASSGGAELILGMNIQLQIQNPPVPSAGLLSFHALLHARTPINTLPGSQDVGLLLQDMPRSNVWAELDAGDPLAPLIDTLMQEFVHQAYENGGLPNPPAPFIPHVIDQHGLTFTTLAGNVVCNAHTEIFDDEANLARQITVSRPTATTIKISLPVYLRLYNIVDSIPVITLLSPMGMETRIEITAPFESPPGSYRAKLSMATASTTAIMPAGSDIAPAVEGQNFTANDASTSGNLKTSIATELANRGVALATALGDLEFQVPTTTEIETVIADHFYADLVARDYIALWSPTASNSEFHVDNVTVGVQPDALNIALNAGAGADVSALGSFVPDPNEFAIALSQASTQQKIDQAIVQAGFNALPKRFREDDHDVDLNSLNVTLVDHAIRMTGTVTVIDAILGSIDVDASFKVDVGLHWNPNGALNSAGGQKLEHHIIGDPDVDADEGVAFWIIAIILTIISFGAGGVLIGIITVIILLVVRAIVESIGSDMLVNGVTGAIDGITAWPPNLSRIGRVRAVFNDPVDISTSGLVIAGTLEVISSCETTAIAAAKTAGAYTVNAVQSLALVAQKAYSNSAYFWNPGDGSPQQALQNINHAYLQSGVYIAKHGLTVLDPGGAASRHFARVKVKNVPPTVDAGPDLIINEGEEVWLEGSFEDVEFLDTHAAIWNFGDDHPVEPGSVVETNTAPKAKGITRAKHAWCDNGTYIVVLQIIDVNGGVGCDRRIVEVRNVPPQVICPDVVYAYCCSPITLVAHFIDPGWCDTHTAKWHFGDCTEDLMAEVKETNSAPAAVGTASASHTYSKCGSFYAVCTVMDDDGGVGTGVLRVDVVHLINPKFEQGFTYHVSGKVANGWTAFWKTNDVEGEVNPLASYAELSHLSPPPNLPNREIYFCERCLVYEGRRSQRIKLDGELTAGIYQKIGANPEWDYQVSCMYMIPPGKDGIVKLGLDPTGGGNPYSTNIKWVSGNVKGAWSNLTVPIKATEKAISIWIALESPNQGSECCVDAVELIAIQNQACPPCTPVRPQPICIEFEPVDRENLLPSTYEKEGVSFTTADSGRNHLIASHHYANRYGLEIRGGEIIELNSSVNRVTMEFDVVKESELVVVAEDAKGRVLQRLTRHLTAEENKVVVAVDGIFRLQLMNRPDTSLLRICLDPKYQNVPDKKDPGQPDPDKIRLSDFNRFKEHLAASSAAEAIALYRAPDEPETYILRIFTEDRSKIDLATLPGTNLKKEITSTTRSETSLTLTKHCYE